MGCAIVLALLAVVLAVTAAVRYWYISVPVMALGITGYVWYFLNKREKKKMLTERQKMQSAQVKALDGRELRKKARTLLQRDPTLATELCIGRPDLSRDFKDGDLIDINHISDNWFFTVPWLSGDHAKKIVQVRQQLGAFSSIDELRAYTELPVNVLTSIEEHAVFLKV